MAKERLDVLLVEKGLCDTREKAKGAIMAGLVLVNGQMADKPGVRIDTEAQLTVKGKACPYVSRGGFKLEKALRDTGLTVEGAVCADIGASTGGFTDCMLQNGARRVYAIDVGYGQLDWKLRNREDVVNMERTNIREVTPETLAEPLDMASVDVSFISLRLVLPVVARLLKPGGWLLCLIKPQFEAGREYVGKKGVVRDARIHQAVVENIVELVTHLGFGIRYLSFSPIKGPKGNIEFLLGASLGETSEEDWRARAAAVVAEAHGALVEEA